MSTDIYNTQHTHRHICLRTSTTYTYTCRHLCLQMSTTHNTQVDIYVYGHLQHTHIDTHVYRYLQHTHTCRHIYLQWYRQHINIHSDMYYLQTISTGDVDSLHPNRWSVASLKVSLMICSQLTWKLRTPIYTWRHTLTPARDDLQRRPNRTDDFSKSNRNRTEPTVFLKTEPNLKNPFRTSLYTTTVNTKLTHSLTLTFVDASTTSRSLQARSR